MDLISTTLALRSELGQLRFGFPVTHVYNPLDYAWEAHRNYLARYGGTPREILLIGMNPGPWGMVQTGVPFGEIEMVGNWLGIEGRVVPPRNQHPKRPVLGFSCKRREASGRRLWGWAKERFGTPAAFFSRFLVGNYCPLCFFTEEGTNLTPDKLPLLERQALQEVCDRGLARMVDALQPRYVLGIGRFAERRVAEALRGVTATLGGVPHPSPASPGANRGWSDQMDAALRATGIALPDAVGR